MQLDIRQFFESSIVANVEKLDCNFSNVLDVGTRSTWNEIEGKQICENSGFVLCSTQQSLVL